MRYDQVRTVHPPAIEKKDIQIEGSGRIRERADPSETALGTQQKAHQLPRLQRRLQYDNRI